MDSNPSPATAIEDEDKSFMNSLKSADWKRYCYQKDMICCLPWFSGPDAVYRLNRMKYDEYENQSFPIVKGRDLVGGVKHYSNDELLQITGFFDFLTRTCYTLFGTLHEGTIDNRPVLVKTWEFFQPLKWRFDTIINRMHDELNLLRQPEINSHPNVVKLIGFHCERRLAVVYEGRSGVQLLHKIIPYEDFSWNDRMKVAIDMASVLKLFHEKGLVHGGMHSKNILVDKEKCPLVFDFRLFSYAEDNTWAFMDCVREHFPLHCEYLGGPEWSMGCDIFAYGILLLELINKQVYHYLNVRIWENEEILNYDYKKSAVHDSFYVDDSVALKITKLAVNCLKINMDLQPTIEEVVKELKDLVEDHRPNKIQKISEN